MKKQHFRVKGLLLLAVAAVPLAAQESELPASDVAVTVTGMVPANLGGMPEGPEVEGFISATKGDRMQVTSADGTRTVIALSETSEIRSSGGFLGLGRDKLGRAQLLNGLPVSVRTVQWGDGLIASRIALKTRDLKTATMIRTGTEQGFAEQTAATEALRSRVADIDQYNVKGTTNVYFDTGKWNLTGQSQAELCNTAAQAGAMDNALLLVVGYTDSTGDYDFNQTLSERRAARVVNHLQQACGWKPYRMLTPTGMAEADPAADNATAAGKAQNRRVAVNILVSKGLDGL
jgi:OmpA-OmpF porin, OOP family